MSNALFRAAQVLAGAGVDGDDFADADERRHGDLQAGLQHGRLVLGGGGGALHGRLGLDHLQLDRRRQLEAQRLAFVEDHVGLGVFLHVGHQLADQVGLQRVLVAGFDVHEDVAVAVLVDVFHLTLFQVGLLDLVVGLDAAVQDVAGLQVLELEGEDGPPVAGRVQVAVHHVLELAVVADDDHPLADLAEFDRCHENLRLSMTFAVPANGQGSTSAEG